MPYRDNILFIHIPKTGGTSIKRALNLNNLYAGKNTYTIDGVKTAPQHLPLDVIPVNPDDMFVFTFVRSPYTRVVSEWNWHHRDKQKPPLVEWAEQYYANPTECHQWKQSRYEGNYDFVGRFEYLEEDFKRLCKIIGRNVILPHAHKTEDNYSLSVDEKEKIYNLFIEDFEIFGYEK